MQYKIRVYKHTAANNGHLTKNKLQVKLVLVIISLSWHKFLFFLSVFITKIFSSEVTQIQLIVLSTFVRKHSLSTG
jgi:hypothetical protein